MRLAGGTSPNEGRVEICDGEGYGTVCDDHWDTSDSEVVCHQLGYLRQGKLVHLLTMIGTLPAVLT